jgi:hypothetical protein
LEIAATIPLKIERPNQPIITPQARPSIIEAAMKTERTEVGTLAIVIPSPAQHAPNNIPISKEKIHKLFCDLVLLFIISE